MGRKTRQYEAGSTGGGAAVSGGGSSSLGGGPASGGAASGSCSECCSGGGPGNYLKFVPIGYDINPPLLRTSRSTRTIRV